MTTRNEIFAVDMAAVAREVAMDILPLEDIQRLHQLTDEQWIEITTNVKFQHMLHSMQVEWNSASNTPERVKAKASTGLEAVLETYIRDILDPSIPLAQRVEAGKFLAKLGELGDRNVFGAASGERFVINLNIAERATHIDVSPTIDGELA
jgi:hypothetical protein